MNNQDAYFAEWERLYTRVRRLRRGLHSEKAYRAEVALSAHECKNPDTFIKPAKLSHKFHIKKPLTPWLCHETRAQSKPPVNPDHAPWRSGQ